MSAKIASAAVAVFVGLAVGEQKAKSAYLWRVATTAAQIGPADGASLLIPKRLEDLSHPSHQSHRGPFSDHPTAPNRLQERGYGVCATCYGRRKTTK